MNLKRFNYLMRKIERLTGESDLLNEFEQKYMDLKDYEGSLRILNIELNDQIMQLERDLR